MEVMKKPKILLKGERISLKKHKFELAQKMFDYVEEDRQRLRVFLPWVDFIKTVEDEEIYIQSTFDKWEEGTLFDFGIYLNENDDYMGSIGIHHLDWSNNNCEIGYWILGKFEGHGYVSEAVTILEKEIFSNGFHRIVIKCSEANEKSASVPKRLGYQLEGVLREDSIELGEYRNTKVFSKLSTD